MFRSRKTLSIAAVLVIISLLISGCSIFYEKQEAENNSYKGKNTAINIAEEKKEILSILDKLNNTLNESNTQIYDNMDMFGPTGEIDFIAPEGVTPKNNAWYTSKEEVFDFISEAGKFYESSNIDKETVNITIKGDVAWLSAAGTFSYNKKYEKSYSKLLNAINNKEQYVSEEKNKTVNKMADFLSNLLFTKSKTTGRYVLPFRCTAVLVKNNNKWQFYQLSISYPVNAKAFVETIEI